jgi:hypothetical protein
MDPGSIGNRSGLVAKSSLILLLPSGLIRPLRLRYSIKETDIVIADLNSSRS